VIFEVPIAMTMKNAFGGGGSMIYAGHVACMGEKENGYRILAGKPEEKRTTRNTKT
jgi:hypothetical protein